MTSDNIQPLSDDQLDDIVGGAALPAAFDKYLNDKGGLKIGTSKTYSVPGGSGGSTGFLTVKGDTEKVAGYLDRLAGRGVSEVRLYPGGGDKYDVFSIADVRAMLG